jgi:hypothetical protein
VSTAIVNVRVEAGGVAIRADVPDYKIAIPSYDRCEALKAKTLDLLMKSGEIHPGSIYVFADPEQLERYQASLKDTGVHEVKGILRA